MPFVIPATLPPAHLSCEQCRQRKTKCNKTNPCSACLKANIPCTAVHRHRLPRGRSRVHKRDTATVQTLSDRIARLEAIISSQPNLSSGLVESINRQPAPNDEAPSFTTKLESFVAPDFWVELSDAVAGLRDMLEVDEVDSEDQTAESSVSNSVRKPDQSNIVLSCCVAPVSNRPRKSPRLAEWLLVVYKERVDPIFKPLHWPTTISQIKSQKERPSSDIAALECAIHFTATCSLFENERGQRGLSVETLLQETEAALVEAGLLTTNSVVLLQAFVIYLAGLRALRANAQQYTLTATAIRLANAQGIPMRSQFKHSLEAETHKRLWFCIGVLDLQSAFDRGSQPLINSDTLASLPLHVNDADLSLDRIPSEKSQFNNFTDMSLSLIIYQAGVCQRRITEIGSSVTISSRAAEVGKARSDQKLELDLFKYHVEQMTLLCRPSDDPIRQFTIAVASECLVAMRLLLHRPLHQPHEPLSTSRADADPDFDVLSTATEVLESNQMKRTQHQFAQWAWFAWVKWYALAVVLAELCTASGPVADRAWKAAQKSFDDYADTVADARSGLLWKPIAKLMRKAKALREASERERVPSVAVLHPELGADDNHDHAMNLFGAVPDENSTNDWDLSFGNSDYFWNQFLGDIDDQLDFFNE